MFVKLEHPDGKVIYINPDYVASVHRGYLHDSDKTVVNLTGQPNGYIIKGTPDDVMSALGYIRPYSGPVPF